MGVVIGWVIITGSISACCADKCAYYYNLTFNIILCLAFVAGDLYFAIMEDVTWDIAGGALGGVLFVMAIMIGLVCALCTDRYDFDFQKRTKSGRSYTLVRLNSGMVSVTQFLKFPIFRRIDVFRNPKIPDF